MDFADLKKVAFYLREKFDGNPIVERYYCADESRYVDIVTVAHEDGLNDLGTLGGCLRKNYIKPEVLVEIVGVVDQKYSQIFAETISFLVLCMDTDRCCYKPGTVIVDAIPDNDNYKMKHIYLCNPFCWHNLDTISINKQNIAFLQALPISEAELAYLSDNDADSFENLLESNNIKYFDLERESII